jgi:hypothetical protein
LSLRFDFKYNADGALALSIQKSSPGQDKEANWLPATGGRFILMPRRCGPKESLPGGTWKPPTVKQVA